MASSIDPGSCSTDDRDRIIQTYAGSLGTVCELDHVVVHPHNMHADVAMRC
jgi:hypothetical protein